MTVDDSLAELLWRFSSSEDGARIVGSEDVKGWPEGMFAELERLGMLAEHTPASRVTCPACELGHVEEIEFSGNGDVPHAVIRCPEFGRADIEIGALRRWRLHDETLTRHLQRLREPVAVSDVLGWDGATLSVDRAMLHHMQNSTLERTAPRLAEYRLVPEGRGWSATFEGSQIKNLPNLKGFRDIHYLLSRAPQPVLVIDLQEVLLVEDGLALIGPDNLRALRALIGKPGIRDKDVEKYLRQVCRLDGRPRSTASPLHKAVNTVRNRINRAIREISKENGPMANHLDQRIGRGPVFSYRPLEPIPWEL